jgi:hypothetical protein
VDDFVLEGRKALGNGFGEDLEELELRVGNDEVLGSD